MNNDYYQKYGPWAIVTGASDGIGQAIAIELARKGLKLILVSRRKEKLEELAEKIKSENKIEIEILSLDLSDMNATQKLFEFTKKFDVGLLVAAAGFGTSGALLTSDIKSELNMIDLNCRTVVEQSYYFGKLFAEKKRGGIILMSSLVAFQGVPKAANYAATKSFIQTLAEGLRYEFKPYGISVLAAAPGPVDSGFAKRANMVMSRAAQPKNVAKVMVEALGKSITVRPGFLSKFLGWSLQAMPRSLRVLMMKKIMGEMTDHQDSVK